MSDAHGDFARTLRDLADIVEIARKFTYARYELFPHALMAALFPGESDVITVTALDAPMALVRNERGYGIARGPGWAMAGWPDGSGSLVAREGANWTQIASALAALRVKILRVACEKRESLLAPMALIGIPDVAVLGVRQSTVLSFLERVVDTEEPVVFARRGSRSWRVPVEVIAANAAALRSGRTPLAMASTARDLEASLLQPGLGGAADLRATEAPDVELERARRRVIEMLLGGGNLPGGLRSDVVETPDGVFAVLTYGDGSGRHSPSLVVRLPDDAGVRARPLASVRRPLRERLAAHRTGGLEPGGWDALPCFPGGSSRRETVVIDVRTAGWLAHLVVRRGAPAALALLFSPCEVDPPVLRFDVPRGFTRASMPTCPFYYRPRSTFSLVAP